MKNALVVLTLLAAFAPVTVVRADDAEDAKVLEKAKELERSVTKLVAKVSPAYVVIGGGSGVVVSPDGYMLTNHHVAGSKPVGQIWRVKIAGRDILDAKVIGHDPVGDISLLKLDGKDFTYIPLGDSDAVKVGDYALALGNPFGYSKDSTPTVTQGVVSAVHRYQDSYSDAIQTDAPINPGNSGGPLINLKGELIGINGRIAFRNGVKINTGIGYAIPANQIQRFMDSFKKGGIVHHGYLAGIRRIVNTQDGGDGALINDILDDSEASTAGFKKGDIIVEADGRPVEHQARLLGILGTIPAGESVRFKVKRGDSTVEIAMKLSRQDAGGIGGGGAEETPSGGAYLGIRMKTGDSALTIEEVTENSPAAKAGLKPGDVLEQMGRRKLTNVNDLQTRLARRKPGDTITFVVTRDGKQVEVPVTLGKRDEK
jgi:serine protease DegQ